MTALGALFAAVAMKESSLFHAAYFAIAGMRHEAIRLCAMPILLSIRPSKTHHLRRDRFAQSVLLLLGFGIVGRGPS